MGFEKKKPAVGTFSMAMIFIGYGITINAGRHRRISGRGHDISQRYHRDDNRNPSVVSHGHILSSHGLKIKISVQYYLEIHLWEYCRTYSFGPRRDCSYFLDVFRFVVCRSGDERYFQRRTGHRFYNRRGACIGGLSSMVP